MDGDSTPGSARLELEREATFGGVGVMVDRDIHCVDVSNPAERQDEIDDQLWAAATELGFFQVTGHDIPLADIDRAFTLAEQFFALDDEVKARRTMPQGANAGWESKTQKRPSTGTLDQKESYQITRTRMDQHELWPTSDELAGFVDFMIGFEEANWRLAMRLLASFARKLGFDDDFFTTRHDPASAEYQSTLRLLHYFPLRADELGDGVWRAGAHTDYDCLTLLHQRPGQRGLQLCPGAEAVRDRDPDAPLGWTDVEPTEGVVTCNIGDMLMRWSDDQLPSTLHRVMPPSGDSGARYSIAFFAQANRNAIIQGPAGIHEPITAHDFLQQRIQANFVK